MPTENRSSNTEMVSVPRGLLAEAEASLRSTGFDVSLSADLRKVLGQPAQHQGEPVALVEVGADRNARVTVTDQDWLRGLKDKASHQAFHLYTHPAPADQQEPVAFEERVCSIATDIQGIRRLLEDLANKRWPDKDHDLTGGYVSANIGHASAGAKYHLPALERALLGLNELLHMQADPGEVERLHKEHIKALEACSELSEKQRDHWMAECKKRDAQLAERDALLRDISTAYWRNDAEMPYALVERIKALSASAEPSAAVEVEPVETAVFNDPLYNAESDARNASSLLEEVLEWFDDGVGRSQAEFKLMRKIGAWLGRSVPSVDGGRDECAHSYANKVGCPECGEEFGAEPNPPKCKYCGDTGQIMVGRSGDASDGNAPVLEPCEDCERGAPVERDERAQFETCIRREWPMAPISRKRDLLPKDDPCFGDYCDEPLQRAWVGWQMRAALERKPS